MRAAGTPIFFRELRLLLLRVGQELVQRRIEEANRCRVALERPEDAREVVALVREQLGQRGFPRVDRLGEDHLAHRVDAVTLEEHVLRPREADAHGSERDGVGLACSGVSALVPLHAHARGLRAPRHELLEAPELLRLPRRRIAVDQAGDDLRRRRLHLPHW